MILTASSAALQSRWQRIRNSTDYQMEILGFLLGIQMLRRSKNLKRTTKMKRRQPVTKHNRQPNRRLMKSYQKGHRQDAQRYKNQKAKMKNFAEGGSEKEALICATLP